MENKFGKWEDAEVVELFNSVKEFKGKGKPISKAFSDYAVRHGRKPNSVRNYYYAELTSMYSDPFRAKSLGIDLNDHSKQLFVEFNRDESENLVKTVICNLARGKSVRATCLEMSGGNIEKMIRYQNKYRSILKTDTNLIREITKKLDEGGKDYVNPIKENKNVTDLSGNILKMPDNKIRITDSDINSLFLGMVKLIKRKAEEDVSEKLKSECEFANETLRKTLVSLNEKEKLIESLNRLNSDLQTKVKELSEKLIEYRTGTYSLKNEIDRLKAKKENMGMPETLN